MTEKNNSTPENSNSLKIETIKLGNNEVSLCPQRGGIITSLKLNGQEILYLNETNLQDTTTNVRGGIPILFPNAGPITTDSEFSNLKQHGFARISSDWKFKKTTDGFIETLLSNNETLKIYPYKFKLSIIGKFEEDGSFTLTQEVKNEDNKEIPVSFGLHPYFKVPTNQKNNIKFNFPGGEIIKNETQKWSNDGTTSIYNPQKLETKIPTIGTLTINISPEYQRIWTWSIKGENFICIEPVMRDVNGLVENPEKIQPQNTFSASVNFKLK
jgi:galactose mutarotase-like enzyme